MAEPRPQIALRKDSAGELDDIVVQPVDMFRAEFMSDRDLWLCCYLPGGERITWDARLDGVSSRSKGRLVLGQGEMPTEGTYDDWDALTPERRLLFSAMQNLRAIAAGVGNARQLAADEATRIQYLLSPPSVLRSAAGQETGK
jgi:hypothetical protein